MMPTWSRIRTLVLSSWVTEINSRRPRKCQAGGPLACPDDEVCIDWKCDPVAGKCKPKYKVAGVACTEGQCGG